MKGERWRNEREEMAGKNFIFKQKQTNKSKTIKIKFYIYKY
jgi:hypothetical protein